MILFFKWIGYALAVMFTAWLIPGISIENFISAMLVAVVLGLINIFIKPILLIITLPINLLTLGFLTLIINALLLMFAGFVTPGFAVEGFLSAFFGSLLLSIITTGINFISR